MRREQRSFTVETVEVPVSVIASSDLAAEYLPSLLLIHDGELKKMGADGKAELARRKKQRAVHVKAGRVRYVRKVEGFQGHSFYIASNDPKLDRRPDGHLTGYNDSTASGAIWGAKNILEHNDEGGVIYVDVDKFWDEPKVIDIRPNACEALAKTGKHDWSYVPTGDDICRSCGLLV